MSDDVYPAPSSELSHKRHELAPDTDTAFRAFSKQVFAESALSAKAKQIIAVSVAHVTQCPYCIRGHTKAALRAGAMANELMEAIWVAAECVPAARSRTRRSRFPRSRPNGRARASTDDAQDSAPLA